MSEKLRVGLLFGGRSVEHEVSVVSARGVAGALAASGHVLVPLGVTGDGSWLTPERSREILDGGDARVEAGTDDDGARIVVAPGAARLLRLRPGRPAAPLEIDVAFPLIHGWGGEDGRLQGVLETAGIPYVGSGVLGSALAMDKAAARRIFAAHGLPLVPWIEGSRADHERDPEGARQRILAELELPVFVKPANGGSSVGISRVDRAEDLAAAVEEALRHDRRIVVEQGIDAREVECSVLGRNDDPSASVLGEIVPSREFYDYEAKYGDADSKLIIPAELDRESAGRTRELALTAFRVLGISGFARVDFLIDRPSGRIFLNEVNTLPGFTPISMFPKLWEASGLSYPRLIERLVELARERWSEERGLRTRWTPDRG